MIGIYLITNKINGKQYIGQSVDIIRRWRAHRNTASTGNTALYIAMRKYGIENFDFQILEECNIQELNDKEIQYIEKYDTYFNGYNETRGGWQYSHNVKISDEELEKIIDFLQNSKYSQKEIAQIFNVGEDTISEINTGKSRYLPGYQYPIRQNHIINYCIDCGVKIGYGSVRCPCCNAKSLRKIERPDKETLQKELFESNFLAVGRKYGVTDNAIRKWCKAYGLSTKASDYKWKKP